MSKQNLDRSASSNANRMALLIGTVIAAVLIALVVFARQGSSGQATSFDLSGRPVLGPANAPVTVVVFEDYKCPNCKRFDEQELPVLQSRYFDTGKAKLVAMSYPFLSDHLPDNDSLRASVAAKCVFRQGNARFWAYNTLLFRGQGDERMSWATEEALTDLAGNVEGLDRAAFTSCLRAQATLADVNADKAQGDRAGLTGTPSVYVNGRFVQNYSAARVGDAIDAASK